MRIITINKKVHNLKSLFKKKVYIDSHDEEFSDFFPFIFEKEKLCKILKDKLNIFNRSVINPLINKLIEQLIFF